MLKSRPVGRRQLRTYLLLSLAAGLTLVVFSPQLLVAFGVLGVGALQASATLTGILVGLPAFIVLVVAAGFSVAGLVRGPARLRLQVAAWWIVVAGGVAASIATEQRPGYNPYLGTPHPGLGVSDVFLAVGLVLGVVLPQVWKRRASAAVPDVRGETGE